MRLQGYASLSPSHLDVTHVRARRTNPEHAASHQSLAQVCEAWPAPSLH